MKVKQITLGSSTLVLAALLTACGGSSSSGVQKPTPLVANTNNSGNHGATNHGNHGATNHGNHGNHGANNHGNHGNHGANNHGNHGNHGANNHGNHGNHGANNHGNHGNHGATNHGNHGANNSSATISYAALRSTAIKETNDYARKEFGVVPKNTGYTLSVDGKEQAHDIDLRKYPKGHSTLNVKETVTGEVKGKSDSLRLDSKVYLFKQDYSLIAGIHNQSVTLVSHQQTKPINEGGFLVRGASTKKLPTTGKFNYLGSGKVESQSGVQEVNFSYNVDFGAKTGSGSLGNITLSEDKIKAVEYDDNLGYGFTAQGIEGKATDGRYFGEYTLGFFGPDAAEIVGSVELGNDKEHVGGIFGGTKQAK